MPHRHIRIWFGHPDTSAVAEGMSIHKQLMNFQDTRILPTVPGYMDRIIREVVEFGLHPNNMNREDGLNLNGSWKPLFRLLRESRRPLSSSD
jgi:hypothetical protein